MRKNAISIELRDKAMDIYKGLPSGVKKGEWVSDAIIEKWAKEHGEIFTKEQLKRIRQEINKVLEGRE
jgi:ribosomal protein L14E/L6E/L27E